MNLKRIQHIFLILIIRCFKGHRRIVPPPMNLAVLELQEIFWLNHSCGQDIHRKLKNISVKKSTSNIHIRVRINVIGRPF